MLRYHKDTGSLLLLNKSPNESKAKVGEFLQCIGKDGLQTVMNDEGLAAGLAAYSAFRDGVREGSIGKQHSSGFHIQTMYGWCCLFSRLSKRMITSYKDLVCIEWQIFSSAMMGKIMHDI